MSDLKQAMLENQVVLITGGAGGQGRAHAVKSAEYGADVVLLDRFESGHEAYSETIETVEKLGRKALALGCDITSQDALDRAVGEALEVFGRIDSVIVNAGVHRGGLFWEMSEEDWNFVLDVNLNGAWRTLKAVAPSMIERGQGSVIIISSVDAFDPEEESTAYGVSKTAVQGLMKYAAYELAPRGVRCNAIAPGFIDTAMVNSQEWYDLLNGGGPGSGTRDDLVAYARTFTLMKNTDLLQGSDVADTAVYLNSPLAKHVTGVTIPVDAGHLLVRRINENPVIDKNS